MRDLYFRRAESGNFIVSDDPLSQSLAFDLFRFRSVCAPRARGFEGDGERFEQLCQGNAKAVADVRQSLDRWIRHTSFHRGDVRAVNKGLESQSLLRFRCRDPAALEVLTEAGCDRIPFVLTLLLHRPKSACLARGSPRSKHVSI